MIQPVELVVIGASLGGLEALQKLLAVLPPWMPAIAIAQHRITDHDGRLLDLLGLHSALPVVEPDDKTAIVPGTVFLAPSDYHLLVEPGWFSLSTEGPVQHARPSIDVLFETAADAYGARTVAVALTCSSLDGVAGAVAVHRRGGCVLVQDPDDARSPILSRGVIAEGVATVVASLEDLPGRLVRACAVAATRLTAR